jgi:hypothetical protein
MLKLFLELVALAPGVASVVKSTIANIEASTSLGGKISCAVQGLRQLLAEIESIDIKE